MDYSYCYTLTITPEDIYGAEGPRIPEGYKMVDFRPVRKGDMYLPTGTVATRVFTCEDLIPGPREPRLILEKLPEKRLLEIENCGNCFHRSSFGYCTMVANRYVSSMGIPNWCPLPKAR